MNLNLINTIINYLVLHALCCDERKWRLKETTCVHVCTSVIGCCYYFLYAMGYAIQSWQMSQFLFLDWMVSFLVMCNIINFVANIIFIAYGTVLFSYWAHLLANCEVLLKETYWGWWLCYLGKFIPPREKKDFLSHRLVSGGNKNATEVNRLLVSEGRGRETVI